MIISFVTQVHPDTIAHVWKSPVAEVNQTTSHGLQTLYSTCWYLDYIAYGKQWPQYYSCDPQSFNGLCLC
jgi:hexosaminidase